MGYENLFKRCIRISCAKLFSCFSAALTRCRLLILERRQTPRLAETREDEEENIGLLRETDLGLEEEFSSNKDEDLYKKAKHMVETKAGKELEKIRKAKTPPKPNVPVETATDAEEAWLDNFDAGPDLEINIPEDADVDFLT